MAGSEAFPSSAATVRPTHWWQSNLKRRRIIAFYLFLLPWMIGFVIFTAGPMLVSAGLAFTRYDILSPPQWVGLENFERMFFDDPLFWVSLRVTAVYTFVVVPLNTTIAYCLALLLNRNVFALSFWRTAYYVPYIVPTVAASYLFWWLFNKDFGAINGLLWSIFRLDGPSWLGTEEWVLPAFIIMSAWGAGGGIILFLAAMQQVPTDLYDSAKVDGANAFQRLRNVTIPMTSFVIFFTFVTGLIYTFSDLQRWLHLDPRRPQQRLAVLRALPLPGWLVLPRDGSCRRPGLVPLPPDTGADSVGGALGGPLGLLRRR